MKSIVVVFGIGCLAVAVGCGTMMDRDGDGGMADIGPEGGQVTTSYGVALSVGAGALNERVRISIERDGSLPAGAAEHVRLQPGDTRLAKPVRLSFTLPEGEADAGNWRVMTRVGDEWTPVAGQEFDPSTRAVRGDISELSSFALIRSGEDCSNRVDDDRDGQVDCADSECMRVDACLDQACRDDPSCNAGGEGECRVDTHCERGTVCVNTKCVAPEQGVSAEQ